MAPYKEKLFSPFHILKTLETYKEKNMKKKMKSICFILNEKHETCIQILTFLEK
jgi:hypothetical protein